MTAPLHGLPDPEIQGAFYDGVVTKRLLAWVVDSILILVLGLLLLPLTAFAGLFFLPVFYLFVGFLYRAATLARWSATPGMALFAIEFRTLSGARFDAGHAIAHTFGYSVSMSFVLPQVISILMMLTGPRAQGLTDVILGTAAINRPAD